MVEFYVDLSIPRCDSILSRPAKPLPSGMLKCGGFFVFEGESVKYSKPALTYQQQADLLLRRGLAADREELIGRLKVVSYYRLSGHWYPLRNPDDTLQPGTTLDRVNAGLQTDNPATAVASKERTGNQSDTDSARAGRVCSAHRFPI